MRVAQPCPAEYCRGAAVGLIPGDTIRIGVNVRERQGEKTGFLRFVFRKFGEEKEPETQDEYLAILAWTRELGS